MFETVTGEPFPALEVGALCTGVAGVLALYMLTGVYSTGRPLAVAAAPSVQPSTGVGARVAAAVSLADSVWVCGGRLAEVSEMFEISEPKC